MNKINLQIGIEVGVKKTKDGKRNSKETEKAGGGKRKSTKVTDGGVLSLNVKRQNDPQLT